MSWLGIGATIVRSNIAGAMNRLLRRILQEDGDFLLQENDSKILY